jgi:hypothetical protein
MARNHADRILGPARAAGACLAPANQALATIIFAAWEAMLVAAGDAAAAWLDLHTVGDEQYADQLLVEWFLPAARFGISFEHDPAETCWFHVTRLEQPPRPADGSGWARDTDWPALFARVRAGLDPACGT